MTRNQHHQTEITDHEAIAGSREGVRSPRILPPGPDQPAKPFQSTPDAFAIAPASAAAAQTNAQTDL